ncbi:MAG: ATP-binding protein [Planctomycetota bacterium]
MGDSEGHTARSESTAEGASQSLNAFFTQSEPASLDNCDREPIHLAGAVQEGCALVAFGIDSRQVLAASENCQALGLVAPQPGMSLQDCLPEVAEQIEAGLLGCCDGHHALLDHVHVAPSPARGAGGGGQMQCIYHEHQGVGFVELWPCAELSATAYRGQLRTLRVASARIMNAPSFEDALTLAVATGREMTGMARVKIYAFQPDWAGKVVAESRAEHVGSFLGLLFPATDIPKQARYLMGRVPFRGVLTAGDRVVRIQRIGDRAQQGDLDMSWSLTRAVSPMHTEYLRNMGVGASFSVSLVHRDTLWGLIACHHDAGYGMPFELCAAMGDLANALMAKLEQERAKEAESIVRRLRIVEQTVVGAIRTHGDIEGGIVETMSELRLFLRADGLAFSYGEAIYLNGETPPATFVEQLIEWVRGQGGEGMTFLTESLHENWPEAAAHVDTACGVLVEPVRMARGCHLVWFRAPATKVAHWAGQPNDKGVDQDGSRTLQPRNSFAMWLEEHRGRSEQWQHCEVDAAREILKTMLDVIVHQLQLAHSTKNLQTFSYAAAHDIKSPLRHIQALLSMMREVGSEDPQETMELLELASASSERLRFLVDGLMEYLVLEQQQSQREVVSLRGVLKDVSGVLAPELKKVGGRLEFAELPDVLGGRALMLTLLMNLIGNAIKYRDPDTPLRISVSAFEKGHDVCVAVADNGQGIPAKYAQVVFEPLRRLHRHSEIEGSGLGLAISQRIVELHGGRIVVDTSHTPGARLVATFRRATLTADGRDMDSADAGGEDC